MIFKSDPLPRRERPIINWLVNIFVCQTGGAINLSSRHRECGLIMTGIS